MFFFKKPTQASGASKEHIQTIGNCEAAFRYQVFDLLLLLLLPSIAKIFFYIYSFNGCVQKEDTWIFFLTFM